MRRIILALLFAAAPALAQAPPQRELTVTNQARQPIRELYVSVATSDDWGDDRLGTAGLAPGRPFRVRLGRMRDCRFDLRVVYADEQSEERRGVDICRNRQVSFDGSAARAAERYQSRQVELANRSALPIIEAYLSPAASRDWGTDLIADALAPGGRTTLSYAGPCEAELRVVFQNQAAEERRGIDVCELPSIPVAPGWTTAATLAAPEPPAAAVESDLTVVNRSRLTILSLYVFADGTDEPGEDRLGSDTLDAGDRVQLRITRGAECLHTLRVVYEGAAPDKDRAGIDLCSTREVSVGEDGIRTGNTGAFRNGGRVPVVALRVDRPGDPPGPDRLGAAIIGVGGTFELDAPTPGECLYIATATFRDGRDARFGADLCQGEEITLR